MVTIKQVEEAQYYFGGLSCDCMNRLSILVDDKEKVESATSAALALKPLKFSDEKKRSLREMFVAIQDDPHYGRSIDNVIEMGTKYSQGKRKFSDESLRSANTVCFTYVGLARVGEIKI